MLLHKNRIVVTGGTGRFASALKRVKTKYSVLYPSKSNLNILKENSIINYLERRFPGTQNIIDPNNNILPVPGTREPLHLIGHIAKNNEKKV